MSAETNYNYAKSIIIPVISIIVTGIVSVYGTYVNYDTNIRNASTTISTKQLELTLGTKLATYSSLLAEIEKTWMIVQQANASASVEENFRQQIHKTNEQYFKLEPFIPENERDNKRTFYNETLMSHIQKVYDQVVKEKQIDPEIFIKDYEIPYYKYRNQFINELLKVSFQELKPIDIKGPVK
jgi:hypothetical protein